MPASDSTSPSRHWSPRAGNGQKQRRRIARRSNMSRSNTTPDLGIMAPASMYSGCVITAVPDEAGLVNTSSSSESFPSMTNGSSFGHSPTVSTGSGSSATMVEGKKKQGLFGCKAKGNDSPKSSHAPPLQLSPLPPLTPVKAAQFLGVECGTVRTRSGSLGSRVQYDEFNGLLVRSIPEHEDCLTQLTNPQESASEKTESIEEDVVPGATQPKCLWTAGNRKAQRMLGIAPSRGASIKRGAGLERSTTETPAIHSEKGNLVDYNSEPDAHTRAPAKSRKCRTRKKAPKSLDRMTPITEISCDELRSSYQDSEHNPELELISEYERDPSSSSGRGRRPLNPLPFTINTSYELEEGDALPADVDSGKHAAAEVEEHVKYSDRQAGVSNLKQELPAVIHLRGPLQSFEDRLLDATEANLAIQRMRSDANDAARFYLEAKGCCLRASHKAMKKEFVAMRPDALVEESDNDTESESDDGRNLVSICGSIDLEEDPVVDLVELMTCTNVTASVRKLVDVVPKKSKPTTPPKREVTANSSSGLQSSLKSNYIFQHDEKAGPFKELICNVNPTLPRSPPPAKLPKQIRKTKKSNNLCSESRILIENWVSTNDPVKQRPLSDRLDKDVLSDQQIPPAPFPKDTTNNIPTTSPPPPRKSSKQHFCFRNGHILHPIKLRSIPDEAAINALNVRPYIRTYSGRKMHVQIPVFCDRCGEDVREELWECKLKVCRMVVCKGCAEDLEAEWKRRVIGEWEN